MEVRFLLTSYYSIGAEGGIRTHGRLLTYANFQDWCHKPTRPPLHMLLTFASNSIYINIFTLMLSIVIFGFLHICEPIDNILFNSY